MNGERGTLDGLVSQLSAVLAPLAGLTEAGAPDFVARLGLPLTDAQAKAIAPALSTTTGSFGVLIEVLRELQVAIDAEQWDRVLEQVLRAGAQISTVIAGFDGLTSALASLGLPAADLANLPRRMSNLLLADFLGGERGVPELLEFLGILVRTDHNVGVIDPQRPFYTDNEFHLDRISGWLREPNAQLAALYDWGGPGFDGKKILSIVDRLAAHAGLPSLYDPAATPPTVDLLFALLTPRTANPSGITVALPQGLARSTVERQGQRWTLTAGLDADVPADTALVLAPGRVTIEPPDGMAISATANAVYSYLREPGDPLVLLSLPGGSRITAEQLDASAVLKASPDGAVSVTLGAALRRGKVLITFGDADGFITTILGSLRVESQFELGARFSLADGLRFDGSAGLEVQLGAHTSLGPVDISAVTLLVGISGGALSIGLAADLKATLGPITGLVQGLGTEIPLALAEGNKGNLGPIDVRPRFKPPTGVGLSLDLDVVRGGGFLYFNPDRREYGGALELELAGFIDVKAIGLITTRMPDGSKGFSLIIMLTAEFGGGGLQLGYGFTLLAVGGLIGLNRAMNLTALAEGVRSGAIESIMFPRDVVANAPRILSDLRAFFPPEQGTFLIGPMAKIGWGTPALITVSVGVIIEIPGNVAIVGVLRCILPAKELPLLVLQVNFVGAIEFDKERLWFFAELFDSRILFMTIEGGMGLLVGWGAADLVLTVGGFHPSYRPPPLPFPVPRRLSVDILNQPLGRIRVSGYFAVTSNTVQFGAQAELVLGFDDFGLEGHISFDALFRFSPFAFAIAIAASISLKAFGVSLFSVHLHFVLEGPAPWRARGRGSISLLFFEISADFDITWGENHNPTLPPIDVLPLLSNEIGKVEGWQTTLPTGGNRALVNLQTLAQTDDLVLHPLGTLVVRQRSIPLGVRLDRVGAQRPRDGKLFSLAPAPDSGLVRVSVTDDKFAMAQFQDMDDAAKLSRPAFEDQDAGIELTAAQGTLASARVVRRSARYELIVVDSKSRTQAAAEAHGIAAARGFAAAHGTAEAHGIAAANAAPAPRLYRVSPAVFNQLLDGSSTSRSPLSQREATIRQPFPVTDTVQVTPTRFVIAHVRNNTQSFPPDAAGIPTTASFRSQSTASDALAGWISADHRLAGKLHVIPDSEAALAPAVSGTWAGAAAVPITAAFGASADAAVRLDSGRILLAGGADAGGTPLADTVLFDPVTGAWSATGELVTARRTHSLTKLADGRVLIAGGRTADAPDGVTSIEVYNPVDGAWTATPDAMSARSGHSATLLKTGEVLVAGGTGLTSTLSSAELFDPSTGDWAPAGPMTVPRSGHQAVLLPSGRVLVIGGTLATGRGDAALAYCELYNPATDTWTATGDLSTPRVGHQGTVLRDGCVLVTGGDSPGRPARAPFRAGSLDTAELYDPATGVWTPVADMPGGRIRHRGVLLPTGRVLVLGGTSGPTYNAGFPHAMTYDPDSGVWTTTGGLTVGRWDFAAVVLADGRILAAGGRTRSGAAAPAGVDVLTATAEIFTP
jgi:hypothetical protein